MQRFFLSSDSFDGKSFIITGNDAYHISHSLRMRVGDHISISLSDEKIYDCVLTAFTSDTLRADVASVTECTTESPCKIHIYQALPKSDKLETVIQKSVECGAYSITPFISSRCIAKEGSSFDKKLERYNRISLEAAKQCGRGVVPVVNELLTYEKMLDEASKADLSLFCYEAEGTKPITQLLKPGIKSISVIVGSEGGFSPEEAVLARDKGISLCGLGNRILRCETAPLFVLSCLSFYYELGI